MYYKIPPTSQRAMMMGLKLVSMVQPARLERAASSFAGRRSNPTELRLQKCPWSIANYGNNARKMRLGEFLAYTFLQRHCILIHIISYDVSNLGNHIRMVRYSKIPYSGFEEFLHFHKRVILSGKYSFGYHII